MLKHRRDGFIASPFHNGLRSILDRWWLAALIFLAIRTVVAIIGNRSMHADPDAYRALAEGWAASGTLGRAALDGMVAPTAYRPPLYPWLLSWFVGQDGLWIPAVSVIHLLLGCLTSLLAWDIARCLKGDRSGASSAIAWIAGLLVALDPILLRQSLLLMTETAAAFMSILIWWAWLRSTRGDSGIGLLSATAIGVLMGLSCLLRTSFLVWCPILIGIVALDRIRTSKVGTRTKLIGKAEIVMMAAMVLVLLPWAVRNRIVMGSTIWTTTHGGYTLLLANNPVLFEHYEKAGGNRTWDEDRFHHRWAKRDSGDPRQSQFWDATDIVGEPTAIANEVIDDRLANQSAWSTVRRSPMLFLKACVIRIGWFWALWPASEQASWPLSLVIGSWYGLIFLLLIYGGLHGVRLWWSSQIFPSTAYRWLPAVALVIGLTAVHSVYWSNMRMRAPLVPIVAVVAAWVIVSQCSRASASSHR